MTAAPPALRSQLRLLLLLAAVALAARAITFGNPIVHVDEEYYFTVARAWWQGAIPYVDVWDRKPIGLFALYLPAAALGLPAGVWAYQAIALVAVVATAWLIARLARAAGWGEAAILAATAYILWLNLAGGEGGQSPVFYNLPMAAAACLIIGDRAARPRRAAAAMLFVGIAMQIKYSVVFEGVFFGLWIMARHWRTHSRAAATLALGAGLVATALLPTLIATLVYAAIGELGAFWFANFSSILARGADPFAQLARNIAKLVLILSPLVAMATVAWRDARAKGLTLDQTFLFGWLAAALGGLIAFGTWFDHYALPVMLPATICAAGAVAWRAEVRRLAVPILIVVALGGQALLLTNRAKRGTPQQFATLAAAVGKGPGCLFVYTGPIMLYPAIERCRLSRYLFRSHLSRDREAGAIGVDQAREVRRILARRPEVIVMRSWYRGERAEIRAIVLRAVASRYRPRAAVRVGRDTVHVFAATSPL